MSVQMDAISAITASRPPATDYITFLTIVESHLSKEILPTLNEILQDAELTQNIGWDLIQLLLPFGEDAEQCLNTIARLGNPREVVLKITEALQLLSLEGDLAQEDEEQEALEDEVEDTAEKLKQAKIAEEKKPGDAEHEKDTAIEKFCLLLKLLSIVHPRIKTKYPSRFLSTSLIAILTAYRPSHEATLSVLLFVHTISGKKRPTLPGRKSSLAIQPSLSTPDGKSSAEPAAPDPEAQAEDPKEAAIQAKLLQAFVTHVLEEYVNVNGLEWAARLREHYEPTKVIPVRKSLGERYQEDPKLQQRDTTVGQLVALSRDLGLTDPAALMKAIYTKSEHPEDYDIAANSPESPEDIPLSQAGSLFLIACFIFSSIYLGNIAPVPTLSIFPDHMKLVSHFIGAAGPETIGTEEPGIIDALLFLGIWLEHNNQFVSGPLSDEDFLEHLQSLSLISSNSPSPIIRYHAHLLTSSILHAHPVDRIRLSFITDTLENCPYDNLKASAVSWLKEEIITAHQRNSSNSFSGTVALASTQPYLFPDLQGLADASIAEIWEEMQRAFLYHMAVVNFLYFLNGAPFEHVVPTGMRSVVEEIYLGPLRKIHQKLIEALADGEELAKDMEKLEVEKAKGELDLLGERLDAILE